MTRAEAAAQSPAEYEKDKHSRSAPGGRSGPNKEGTTLPDGPSALGNEIGGENDAQRERAQAIREGDSLPALSEPSQNTADYSAGTGFGQQDGFEKGMADTPSDSKRDNMQDSKNQQWQSKEPNLADIAKNSAGSGAHNPTSNPDAIVSTGNRAPDDVLASAATSGGTESGFGAFTDQTRATDGQ